MGDSEEDILLRGVVRVENVENPEQYVAAALGKVKRHHLERTYDIKNWNNAVDFLEALARKGGRLLKGGEADMDGVAKMVLNDFLRGKIPWFTPPPGSASTVDGVDGRDGRLGEMSTKKRKRDIEDEEADQTQEGSPAGSEDGEDEDAEEDFSGFSDEDEEGSDVDPAENPIIDGEDGGVDLDTPTQKEL